MGIATLTTTLGVTESGCLFGPGEECQKVVEPEKIVILDAGLPDGLELPDVCSPGLSNCPRWASGIPVTTPDFCCSLCAPVGVCEVLDAGVPAVVHCVPGHDCAPCDGR